MVLFLEGPTQSDPEKLLFFGIVVFFYFENPFDALRKRSG